MKKFSLPIYNSALLLLLVVQYSATVYGDEPPQSQDPKLVGYRSVQPPNEALCEFSIDVQTTNTLPLLLTPSGNSKLDFFQPNAKTYNIVLNVRENIRLACPGKNNTITKFPDLDKAYEADIVAQCQGNNVFEYRGESFNIDEIECKIPPASVLRYTTLGCLENVPESMAKYFVIGFELRLNGFVKTIEGCWEEPTKTIHWTAFKIPAKIKAVQECKELKVREPPISFRDYNIVKLYEFAAQQDTVRNLTKSNELVAKYIREGDGKSIESRSWVSRAALSRKWGFIYYAAQMTTDWWINYVPQWSCFDNWEALEYSIGNFVAELEYPLLVYTGTYGQMSLSLKDSTNVDTTESVPYYLSVNVSDPSKNAIPVPKYFWKVLYHPPTKKGTAFVGVNDPWATPENAGLTDYCRDISTKLDWLPYVQPENAVLGLTYVCDVEKLREIIPTLPNIPVNGNLV